MSRAQNEPQEGEGGLSYLILYRHHHIYKHLYTAAFVAMECQGRD